MRLRTVGGMSSCLVHQSPMLKLLAPRYYWGPIVDGVFSWETAWPEYNGFGSDGVGDVSVDQTVLNGVRAHLKTYMMGE